MENILDQLNELANSDFYPFHMPGHKRNEEEELWKQIFSIDITEIDDFDNLHDATGIIERAQKKGAELWGSKESFFLVNGSTCGNLAAIFAGVSEGGEMMVARNCHISVHHGVELRNIIPHYIYPKLNTENDIPVGITVEQVKELFQMYPNSEALMITSPTYEGYVSEIKEIAQFCHEKGILLIVDEAHGAHFGFHDDLPTSALSQGADLVIQSLHKTLPSLTQTAILHVGKDSVVNMEKVRKYLSYFQSTSPSYVFLACMERCVDLVKEKGEPLFTTYCQRLRDFYSKAESLKNIKVLAPEWEKENEGNSLKNRDFGKIVVYSPYLSGKEIYHLLREDYHLQPEMCNCKYSLLMTSIYDTYDSFERLIEALKNIAHILQMKNENLTENEGQSGDNLKNAEECSQIEKLDSFSEMIKPQMVFTPAQAVDYDSKWVEMDSLNMKEQSNNALISGGSIYIYPPGIPFVLPGERITEELRDYIRLCESYGLEVKGLKDGKVAILEIPEE